jgi:hypothetical protein
VKGAAHTGFQVDRSRKFADRGRVLAVRVVEESCGAGELADDDGFVTEGGWKEVNGYRERASVQKF